MSGRLGKLGLLVEHDPEFAADVRAVELVRAVASQLRAMRERAGLTQFELGEAIGLTQGRVSQLESGLMDHAPNLETIALYASACDEDVRFDVSGDIPVHVNPMFSVFGTGQPVGSSFQVELVCQNAAIRSTMTRHAGISQVKGSANRVRLNQAVSASFMQVLGIE